MTLELLAGLTAVAAIGNKVADNLVSLMRPALEEAEAPPPAAPYLCRTLATLPAPCENWFPTLPLLRESVVASSSLCSESQSRCAQLEVAQAAASSSDSRIVGKDGRMLRTRAGAGGTSEPSEARVATFLLLALLDVAAGLAGAGLPWPVRGPCQPSTRYWGRRGAFLGGGAADCLPGTALVAILDLECVDVPAPF
mmetsp:Transcript_59055/g.141045  ORF Transcript_59055/g.141045 Transcript_59055/m.141045 type:complete len:196 (+) Transcript_59055:353-940(+)